MNQRVLTKPFTVTFALLAIICVSNLTACGQKGALYLPNETATIKQAESDTKDKRLVPIVKEQIIEEKNQQGIDPNDY